MTFFPSTNTDLPNITANDIKFANKIRKAIARRNVFISKDRTKWAMQMAILRKQVGEKVVQDTVTWYVINSEELADKLPKIGNCEDFKNRFNWIATVMEKTPKLVQEVSPEIASLYRVIVKWGWGKKVQNTDLSTFLETSYQNYKALWSYWGSKIAKNPPPIDRADALRITTGIIEMHKRLNNPYDFTNKWCLATNGRIANWDKWSGSLNGFIFPADPAHDTFVKEVAMAIKRYSYSFPLSSSQLIELIYVNFGK